MTFSKEDRAAWENSEVIKELEKFTDDILNPSPEPYLPIGEDKGWEDEESEEKLIGAAEDLLEKKEKKEHNAELFFNLKKVAEGLADKSNIKAAYRVERTIQELKDFLEGNHE